MHILQISAEMAPFAKVGGLADVVSGLSRELVAQGHIVTVILPRYGLIDLSCLAYEGRTDTFDTHYEGRTYRAQVAHYLFDDAVRVCLLDTEEGHWRIRPTIYGVAHDDIASFIRFSRAVVDWASSIHDVVFDVFHAHDWHTAFVAALVNSSDPFCFPFKRPGVVLTIHNLDYQGQCHPSDLEKGGYAIYNPRLEAAAKDPTYSCANILKLGIIWAHLVTTVSPTYANEIRGALGGRGLEAVFHEKGARFIGVLNGVDYSYWNPATDPRIPELYNSFEPIKSVIAAKRAARSLLYQDLGLAPLSASEPARPLVATIARLVAQKGLPLIESVAARAEEFNIDCVILGTANDQNVHSRFQLLDRSLRKQGRGAIILQNDEVRAHRIFAGSDIFLVPSITEPCGLTQIIAMKYGSIPVVRKTGGLADTVVDVDYPVSSPYVHKPNGFVFDNADDPGVDSALFRALRHYGTDGWRSLMQDAMCADFSWRQSAAIYIDLYRESLRCM